jgi:hypothetical protein
MRFEYCVEKLIGSAGAGEKRAMGLRRKYREKPACVIER